MIWRGYCDYTYATCMRCGRKVPLEEMAWNDGLLVCYTYHDVDRNVNGAFEMAVANITSQDRQELQPDPKLVTPSDPLGDIQRISASAGSYS